jgi:hypothetical protein
MRAYFPPHFLSAHARELAALVTLPLSLPLACGRQHRAQDALALLALLFLTRCLLDPSNHVYYQVPFVIAVAAWEGLSNRAPVLALLATLGFWLVFHTLAGTGGLSLQFIAYLAVALPLVAVLIRPAFGIDRAGHARAGDRSRAPIAVVGLERMGGAGVAAPPHGYRPAT